MSTPNVPFKTPLGHDELRSRAHRLSQRHRTILLLVDGRRPLAEVLSLAQKAGSSISHFEDVLRMGLVELPIDVAAPDPVMTEPGALASLRTTAVEVDVVSDTVSGFGAGPPAEDALPVITVRTASAPVVRPRGVVTDDAAMLPAALLVTHGPAQPPLLGSPEPAPEAVDAVASGAAPDAQAGPSRESPPEPAQERPSEPLFEEALEHLPEPAPEQAPERSAGLPLEQAPEPAPPKEVLTEPPPEPPNEPVARLPEPRHPAVVKPPAAGEAAVMATRASRDSEASWPAAPVRAAAAAPEQPAFPPPPARRAEAPAALRRGGRRPPAGPATELPEPVTLSELADLPPPPPAAPPVAARPGDDALVEQVRELLQQTVRQNPPPFVSRVPGRVAAARTLQELRDLVLDIERYLSARRPRVGVAGLQHARDLLGLGNTVVSEDSRAWIDDDDPDVFNTTR